MRVIDIPTFLAAMACAAPMFGCANDSAPVDGPTTVEVGEDDGKRDTADGERKATVAGFTLTMNAVARVTSGGQQIVTLKGTASRTLTNAFSYIPDDGFGTTRLTGARTFEIDLDEPFEINTLLSGLPILVALDTASGTPRHFDARITLAPRFARFDGTTRIVVDAPIRPVYVRAADNLRYRGRFTTTSDHASPAVAVPGAASPAVTQRGPRETTFDWTFTDFAPAYDPPTDPVTMSALFGTTTASKSAGIDLRVVRLGLTTDDPYEVWPAPICTPTVAACVAAAPPTAVDLGACGDYRQVLPCVRPGALCDALPPAPVELTPIDASALDPAIASYNTACDRGGTWCSLNSARAFTVPACPDQEVTPQLLFQLLADQDWTDDAYGSYVDDAGLTGSTFLGGGYSTGAPAVAAACDALAGATEAVGFVGAQEVSCHNCHDFAARTILYYPTTRTVIVLDGSYGYDS
jgi:hypothetical protein